MLCSFGLIQRFLEEGGEVALIPRVVSEIWSHSVADNRRRDEQLCQGPLLCPSQCRRLQLLCPTRALSSGTLSAATKYQAVWREAQAPADGQPKIALLSAYYVLGASHRSSPHV